METESLGKKRDMYIIRSPSVFFFSCSLFCLCFFTCVRAENGDWVLFFFVFISFSFIFLGFLECVVDIMANKAEMRGGAEAEMVSWKAE